MFSMDIHRCRFVPYPPSAINALAFSKSPTQKASSQDDKHSRLAVGRANGDIEIWNPLRGSWLQECIFRGGKDRSIEGLVWTQDPDAKDPDGRIVPGQLRLFSTGYSTEVTEWDLVSGLPFRNAAGNLAEIWCITVQPRHSHTPPEHDASAVDHDIVQRYQDIAVGCADGSIVLFSTADSDLQFRKVVSRPVKKKSRLLSLAYQNDHTLIAGYADSTIRIFDTETNRSVRTLSLGSRLPGTPNETLVWSLICLADNSFVSGDSSGTINFWDGKNYVLKQSIKSHNADILSLSASSDGAMVFSGGMDRRTVVYRRDTNNTRGGAMPWKKVSHRRTHQHDVKAMASCETSSLSVVASGGLDTNIIMTPLKAFGKEHHRTLANLPQKSPTCVSASRRLIIAWWERTICIWHVRQADNISMVQGEEDPEGAKGRPTKLVAKIQVSGDESINHADITADGKLLFISSAAGLKAFRLGSIRASKLKVRRLSLSEEAAGNGVRYVKISPDQRWLALLRSKNTVDLFKVGLGSSGNELQMSLSQSLSRKVRQETIVLGKAQTPLGSYLSTICQMDFSPDSTMLVVGDLAGYLHSWILQDKRHPTLRIENGTRGTSETSSNDSEETDNEESISDEQHWMPTPTSLILPKLPNAPLVLAFQPPDHPHDHHKLGTKIESKEVKINAIPPGEAPQRLFVMTSAHEAFEFDVTSGKLSDWSRRNPTTSFPRDFRRIRDPIMDCIWDVSMGKRRVWLHGSTWLWMFDLSHDLPIESEEQHVSSIGGAADGRGTKRKRSAHELEYPQKQSSRRTGSGAGDRIPISEGDSGLSYAYLKVDGTDSDVQQPLVLTDPRAEDLGSDDASSDRRLALTRRHSNKQHLAHDEHVDDEGSDGSESDANAIRRPHDTHHRRLHWHTFKYRPILGILPLQQGGQEVDDEAGDGRRMQSLEVALIERPLLDLELPPRYHGDQEWDRHKG